MLVDRYGRVATDLRVSLTDRCNLRCSYCMPAEGLTWLPTPEMLTDDEVVRLVRVAVERLGVRQVRFTGGEPLLRRGLVDIVSRCAQLRPRPELSRAWTGSTPPWTPWTHIGSKPSPGAGACPTSSKAWPPLRLPA